ncbi:sugar ABC transporter substrate-binding protein [Nocardioides immobilis]|uniref:Sugar ABC transporter substrate-binding protein n=1 Tax=Nocardioides immobilis TaxID=2049295 RepID=A0A417Y0S4_9ACTN|nr:substrate-binding domain-containing protein [Nocardioides immobilis]RHW26249.1 sugar ABC transporter substrate-binding protein [Nocardioides immobilis]
MRRFHGTTSVRSRPRKSTALAAAGAAVAALTLAACGSSSEGGSGSGGAADQDALDEVLSQDFTLPYPTEPVDLGKHTVTFINLGVAAGGNAEVQADQVEVIEKAGWTVDGPYDGEFTPSVQATLIEQAVLRGTDGIILGSIPPHTVPEAIKSAQDAGIPIVCNECKPSDPVDGVTLVGSSAESLVQHQIPMVLAAVNKDDATIVLVTNEAATVVANNAEQERLIGEQCPDCTVVQVPYANSDIGKPTVPSFTNMLREYPPGTIDAVITPFTPGTTAMVNLAEQAGRDDFKIFDTYGDAPIGQQIADGEHAPLLAGTVLISQLFVAYADVDALARVFNGQEVPDYGNNPAVPIMQQNAADYVNEDGRWVPEDMQSAFYEQWGLSS